MIRRFEVPCLPRMSTVGLVMMALICLADCALAVGNCSSLHEPQLVMTRGNIRVEVTGTNITMSLIRDGKVVPGAYLTYVATVVVERSRVFTSTMPSPQCSAPLSPLGYNATSNFFQLGCLFTEEGCLADPLLPRDPNTPCPGSVWGAPCGDLLSYVQFSDMDCYPELLNITVDGHLVETIRITFTEPASDFTVVALCQLPFDDFTYYPPVNNYVGVPFVYEYEIAA